MPKINRDGVQIYYEVHGSGPPLILTHGYSSTSEMWQGQVEALAKQHKLVLWDMRGHGRSDYPADAGAYSEALTIADIAALLDAIGTERAIVGGLSLGGYMSLAFYLAHRERVRALVLCDTGPGYRNPEGRAVWNRRAEKQAVNFEQNGLAAASQSPEVRATLNDHRSAMGLAHSGRGMLAQFDSRVIDSLADIRVPALIVIGERDEPFMAGSRYMANKIPDARLELIAEAGHSSNMDRPEAFNRVLIEFLRALP